MPEFPPMTREELDAVQFSSNPADHRWLATVADREARLRRAVEALSSMRSHGDHWCVQGESYRQHSRRCRACRVVLAENADLLKGEST